MRLTAAAAVTAALLTTAAPAGASHGTLVIRCQFGYDAPTGPTTGTADCRATGSAHGTVLVESPMTGAFSVVNGCPTQSGYGTLAGGGVYLTFTWSRLGATAVVSSQGSIRGSGIMQFSQVCPISGEVVVLTFTGV